MMEPILKREPKKLTLEVVLDEQSNWSPKYLCKRNAGLNADEIFLGADDEVVWVLDRKFSVEFTNPAATPFEDWVGRKKDATQNGDEWSVSGKVSKSKDKKGGPGKSYKYAIVMDGVPPFDPRIIIEK
jgi:hypothetical protein